MNAESTERLHALDAVWGLVFLIAGFFARLAFQKKGARAFINRPISRAALQEFRS